MHQSISPGKSRHLISIHVHRYTTTELPFLVNIKWNDKKMTKQKVQRPMKNRTTLRILCSHLTIESCNNFIQLLQRQKKESTLTKKKLSAIENKHWISHSFLITVLNYSKKKCIQTHIWAFQTAQLNHSRKTEWRMFQLKITVVIFNIIKIIDASSVCNEPWKVHTNEIKTSILYL